MLSLSIPPYQTIPSLFSRVKNFSFPPRVERFLPLFQHIPHPFPSADPGETNSRGEAEHQQPEEGGEDGEQQQQEGGEDDSEEAEVCPINRTPGTGSDHQAWSYQPAF